MICFVTGTDTGVGKTVASAVLAYLYRSEGRHVAYVKPVQTGLPPGAPGDADFVAAVAGVAVEEFFRFDEPLAPAVAAERADATIGFDEIATRIKDLASDADVLLVEGAGGLLAPLTQGQTMRDLAAAIDADLIVVTRPGLGTLNHTALTLEAAAARALPVLGLVVCGWPAKPNPVETTNIERLHAMIPILTVVRTIRGLSVDEARSEGLKRALEKGTALLHYAPL